MHNDEVAEEHLEETSNQVVTVVNWNIDSMLDNAASDDCPDLFDDAVNGRSGHIGIICRAVQALAQGLTVMVQSTSAGSPTCISHGRLVSFFLTPVLTSTLAHL